MSDFEYCKSHLRPHSTGWCGVDEKLRVPLQAKDLDAAISEVREKDWPIYPYDKGHWNLDGTKVVGRE